MSVGFTPLWLAILWLSGPRSASAEVGIRLELSSAGPLVAGETSKVPIVIRAADENEEVRHPLRVSVNVGQFSEIERVEPGMYRTVFTLPPGKHPQAALVAAWRETGKDAEVTFLRLPIYGKARVPVRTTAGADVTVLAGGVRSATITADRTGRAVVPILVAPGVEEVVAQSSFQAIRSQSLVKVDMPPYNRLTIAVTPHSVEANGAASATIHVFHDGQRPPARENVKVVATEGTVEPLGSEAGHYRFSFVPNRESQARRVSLVARVVGDRVSRAEAEVEVGAPIPERMFVESENRIVPADGTSTLVVKILVTDRLGLGVRGLSITSTVSQGTISTPRDVGLGEYEAVFLAPTIYPRSGEVVAAITVEGPGGQALREQVGLRVSPPPWPARATIEIEPLRPVAGGPPFSVHIKTYDVANRPGSYALRLEAEGATASELNEIEVGRYVASVRTDPGRRDVTLTVTDELGHLRETRTLVLDAPGETWALRFRLGAAYTGSISPIGGVELGARPAVLGRRLNIFAGLMMSRLAISRDVVLTDDEMRVELDGELVLLPIELRATVDVFRGSDISLYVGAGIGAVLYAHTADSSIDRPFVERGAAPSVQIVAGGTYEHLFIEALASYAGYAGERFDAPSFATSALLGFRLDLF